MGTEEESCHGHFLVAPARGLGNPRVQERASRLLSGEQDGLMTLQVNLRHLMNPLVQQLLLQKSGEESEKKMTCLRSLFTNISVHLGCYNRIHRPRGLGTVINFSPSWRLNAQNRVPEDLVFIRPSFHYVLPCRRNSPGPPLKEHSPGGKNVGGRVKEGVVGINGDEKFFK